MANPNDYSQYRRQSFRLQGYDYRSEGMYFITICTKDRFPFFGQIIDNQMVLSQIGQIVWDNWFKIPQFSPHIVLDEFVVMPNHIHGILAIVQSVSLLQCNHATGQCNDATPTTNTHKNQFMSDISPKSGSISRVLNSYKGACSKEIKSVALLQCNNAIGQCNNAIGQCNNATRQCNNAIGQCNNAIGQCNNAIGQCNNAIRFGWQSKFHDRIIRNEEELYRIQHYIINNPKNWKEDENHF